LLDTHAQQQQQSPQQQQAADALRDVQKHLCFCCWHAAHCTHMYKHTTPMLHNTTVEAIIANVITL
jgi:hypothetical protein